MHRRARTALLQSLAQLLQSVLDQALVDNPEQRAAEPHCAGFPAVQQLAGLGVIEQDATLEIAHQHTLGEFGHQGGEAIFLLFQARIGLRDARLDILELRIVGRGESIQRMAQTTHGLGTANGQPMLWIDPMDDADLFFQAPGRRRIGRAPELQQSTEQRQQHQAEYGQQGTAPGQQGQ